MVIRGLQCYTVFPMSLYLMLDGLACSVLRLWNDLPVWQH